MCLKALLITRGHAIAKQDIWGHDLCDLAARIPEFPNRLAGMLRVFNDYFNELRYPQELVNVMELDESAGDLLDRLVELLMRCADLDLHTSQPGGEKEKLLT